MRQSAEVIQFQKKQEAKFICSACGGDRACDCNAPAVEKLAEKREQDRQRARRAYEKKKSEQDQQPSHVRNDDSLEETPTETVSDADHEEGLRVIAVRGLLNRAAEAKEMATLGKLQASDITDAMIRAADDAAAAWTTAARNLRSMKAQ